MPSTIAVQLYTLREFTKTPADIAATLKRVKKMGYDAVQISALGPIEPRELAAILQGEGLFCCASHLPFEKIRDETQQVIDNHRLWKCPYLAIGGYGFSKMDEQKWSTFIADYAELNRKFTGSGVRLGYHNHNHEFLKFGGKTVLQRMYDEWDASIHFILDTYWIQYAGADPADWIRRARGRAPCVHFKDMAPTPERQIKMAEVGEGNLNWSAIIEACGSAGTQWHIVEQDNCNGKDPFECVELSLRNMREMGLA